MPKGYIILTEAVHDEAGMSHYSKLAAGPLRQHNAKVLVAADSVDARVVEGEWHGNRTVILEFESVEAAEQFYHSDDYQAAARLRRAAADCRSVILPGFAFPNG